MRAFGETALGTLVKAGASKDGPPPPSRDLQAESQEVLSALLPLLPAIERVRRLEVAAQKIFLLDLVDTDLVPIIKFYMRTT